MFENFHINFDPYLGFDDNFDTSWIFREDLGLCLSGMKLSSVECEELSADTVLIVFHRQPGHTR